MVLKMAAEINAAPDGAAAEVVEDSLAASRRVEPAADDDDANPEFAAELLEPQLIALQELGDTEASTTAALCANKTNCTIVCYGEAVLKVELWSQMQKLQLLTQAVMTLEQMQQQLAAKTKQAVQKENLKFILKKRYQKPLVN